MANPEDLSGLDLWMSSSFRTYSDAGGTTPASTNGAIASWGSHLGNSYLLIESTYGGGFFGKPTLRSDNGFPVVESRTTSNGQAALTQDITAWTPTNISVHWLAKFRPGSTEALQICIGMAVGSGMRFGSIWDTGNPLLATGGPNVDCYMPICADGAYHLISYVRASGNARIYCDGQKLYDGADATTTTDIDTYWLLGFRVGDAGSWQYVADGWVYRAAHSDADVAALQAWCIANRSAIYPKTTTPSPDTFVYFIGNSIWTTAFTSFPCLPTKASTGQTKWSRWQNASLGGQATAGGGTSHGVGMQARCTPEYIPNLQMRPESRKLAVIFELTNDKFLRPSTNQECYDHYVTLAQTLRPYVNKIVAVPCLPRGYPVIQISESDRDAINALIVGNADRAWDAVCPVHLDPLIGLAGCNSNTTYWHPDGIHLKSAGADVFAPYLRTTISQVLSHQGGARRRAIDSTGGAAGHMARIGGY